MTKNLSPSSSLPSHLSISLEIAGYEICAVPTGLFGLDGGAMFGTVPKALWSKSNPPDENNRISMEARALLLKSKNPNNPHKNILIDTGNGSDFVAKYGEKLGSKFSQMYAFDESGPNLLSSLKKHGVSSEQITDVILTHLHFDHAGGATREWQGKIQATFPNAKYYIQKSNLETAQAPNKRERASYFAANFQPLLENNQLHIVDGEKENLLPNISVVVSNGHTTGHQCVIVEDEKQRLVYCGDVIPTSSHVRSAWVMGYDLNPLQIMQEKAELLRLSQNKKTYYYFEHDPDCDMATVAVDRDDYKVQERFILS